MECLVLLRYPNGRTHEARISTPDVLSAGFEFELFGRRWRTTGVMHPVAGRRGGEGMLCVCMDAATEQARRESSETGELR
jgi:hypothetical protein